MTTLPVPATTARAVAAPVRAARRRLPTVREPEGQASRVAQRCVPQAERVVRDTAADGIDPRACLAVAFYRETDSIPLRLALRPGTRVDRWA